MNLKNLGLEELSSNEMVETDGGSISVAIGVGYVLAALAGIGTGIALAYWIND